MPTDSESALDWEDLLLRIHDGGVVPIVGPELLTVAGKPAELLQYALASDLARELRVTLPSGIERFSLADVAFFHLAEIKKRTSNALYSKLKLVLDRALANAAIPE